MDKTIPVVYSADSDENIIQWDDSTPLTQICVSPMVIDVLDSMAEKEQKTRDEIITYFIDEHFFVLPSYTDIDYRANDVIDKNKEDSEYALYHYVNDHLNIYMSRFPDGIVIFHIGFFVGDMCIIFNKDEGDIIYRAIEEGESPVDLGWIQLDIENGVSVPIQNMF